MFNFSLNVYKFCYFKKDFYDLILNIIFNFYYTFLSFIINCIKKIFIKSVEKIYIYK